MNLRSFYRGLPFTLRTRRPALILKRSPPEETSIRLSGEKEKYIKRGFLLIID